LPPGFRGAYYAALTSAITSTTLRIAVTVSSLAV
jgi:hypothetical protein